MWGSDIFYLKLNSKSNVKVYICDEGFMKRGQKSSIALIWHRLHSAEIERSVRSESKSVKVGYAGAWRSLELRQYVTCGCRIDTVNMSKFRGRMNTTYINYTTTLYVLHFIRIALLILNTVANCAPLDTIDVMPARQTATIGPGILKWHISKPIESLSGSSVTNWWNELVEA